MTPYGEVENSGKRILGRKRNSGKRILETRDLGEGEGAWREECHLRQAGHASLLVGSRGGSGRLHLFGGFGKDEGSCRWEASDFSAKWECVC